MPRVLTMLQFRARYGLSPATVRAMLRNGKLQGLNTAGGHWRIVDPGPELLEKLRRKAVEIEQVCLIRGVEVAALLGVSTRYVRILAERGILGHTLSGSRRLYPLAEVLKILTARERRTKKGTGSYARPTVLAWAKKRLSEYRECSPDAELVTRNGATARVSTDSSISDAEEAAYIERFRRAVAAREQALALSKPAN